MLLTSVWNSESGTARTAVQEQPIKFLQTTSSAGQNVRAMAWMMPAVMFACKP